MEKAEDIYKNSAYLKKNESWHEEDSDWKYKNIKKVLGNLKYNTIVDVGCGAGKILENFYKDNQELKLYGFDISENVQDFWINKSESIVFHKSNFLESQMNTDLVLLIDVFEHVEDYYGFLKQLQKKSKHFVFHIPLDMFVLASLTNNYEKKKSKVGHLHYFDYRTALGVLDDTGYNVINYNFTKSYLQSQTKIVRRLRPLRRIGELIFGNKLNSKIFGGYSIMVLCEKKLNYETS